MHFVSADVQSLHLSLSLSLSLSLFAEIKHLHSIAKKAKAQHSEQVEKLSAQIQSRDKQIKDSESKMSTIAHYVDQLEERLASFAIARKEIGVREEKCKELEEMDEQQRGEIAALRIQVKDLTTEKDEMKSLIDLLVEERGVLQMDKAKLEKKIRKLGGECTSLERRFTKKEEEIATLGQDLNESKQKLKEAEQTIEELEELVASVSSQLAEAERISKENRAEAAEKLTIAEKLSSQQQQKIEELFARVAAAEAPPPPPPLPGMTSDDTALDQTSVGDTYYDSLDLDDDDNGGDDDDTAAPNEGFEGEEKSIDPDDVIAPEVFGRVNQNGEVYFDAKECLNNVINVPVDNATASEVEHASEEPSTLDDPSQNNGEEFFFDALQYGGGRDDDDDEEEEEEEEENSGDSDSEMVLGLEGRGGNQDKAIVSEGVQVAEVIMDRFNEDNGDGDGNDDDISPYPAVNPMIERVMKIEEAVEEGHSDPKDEEEDIDSALPSVVEGKSPPSLPTSAGQPPRPANGVFPPPVPRNVPFRKFRKALSKATGIHGVFTPPSRPRNGLPRRNGKTSFGLKPNEHPQKEGQR